MNISQSYKVIVCKVTMNANPKMLQLTGVFKIHFAKRSQLPELSHPRP